MAKGKPSRAFLEALQQQKRTRGESKPGGGFVTPDWFFKKEPAEQTAAPTTPLKPAAPLQRVAGPVASRSKSLSTNTLIYIAVGVIVTVSVIGAVVFKMSGRPASSTGGAVAVEQARPNNSVMDVASAQQVPVQPPTPKAAPPAMGNVASPTERLSPETAAQGRVVGMNYVIFTGYPKDQEQLAHEAAAALNAAGIGATVEKGLAGFQWYTVVGTTGFAPGSLSGPEYQEYLRKVDAVSTQFAGSVKWKRFQPAARKWQ